VPSNHEELLISRLQPLEEKAQSLPWAKQRSWTMATHIWMESGLLTVDLHDLSVRLAMGVVTQVVSVGEQSHMGAVCFISGRGRHSMGRSSLRDAVHRQLSDLCGRNGWQMRVPSPGRLMLIIDPSKAPSIATGGLGLGFWMLAILFFLATTYVLFFQSS
jgi:hypothetical protein